MVLSPEPYVENSIFSRRHLHPTGEFAVVSKFPTPERPGVFVT
jgi:hypothetical protein